MFSIDYYIKLSLLFYLFCDENNYQLEYLFNTYKTVFTDSVWLQKLIIYIYCVNGGFWSLNFNLYTLYFLVLNFLDFSSYNYFIPELAVWFYNFDAIILQNTPNWGHFSCFYISVLLLFINTLTSQNIYWFKYASLFGFYCSLFGLFYGGLWGFYSFSVGYFWANDPIENFALYICMLLLAWSHDLDFFSKNAITNCTPIFILLYFIYSLYISTGSKHSFLSLSSITNYCGIEDLAIFMYIYLLYLLCYFFKNRNSLHFGQLYWILFALLVPLAGYLIIYYYNFLCELCYFIQLIFTYLFVFSLFSSTRLYCFTIFFLHVTIFSLINFYIHFGASYTTTLHFCKFSELANLEYTLTNQLISYESGDSSLQFNFSDYCKKDSLFLYDNIVALENDGWINVKTTFNKICFKFLEGIMPEHSPVPFNADKLYFTFKRAKEYFIIDFERFLGIDDLFIYL